MHAPNNKEVGHDRLGMGLRTTAAIAAGARRHSIVCIFSKQLIGDGWR